jgi:hypothetical protein
MTDFVSIIHPIVTAILGAAAIYHTFIKDRSKKDTTAQDLIDLRLQDLNDLKIRISVLEERTKVKCRNT